MVWLSDVLIVVVALGFGLGGVVVGYRSWTTGDSAYGYGGPVAGLVGDRARYGYDAAVATAVPMIFLGFAVLTPPAVAESRGVSWPTWVEAVLGRTAQVLILGGMALGVTLLLFLFPRFLAPPHVRGERGWIPEWWHQHRAGRRAR